MLDALPKREGVDDGFPKRDPVEAEEPKILLLPPNIRLIEIGQVNDEDF